MDKPSVVLLSAFLLAAGLSAAPALAATPGFTLSATNAIMPTDIGGCSNGVCTWNYGYSTLTVTSVDGYMGGPLITCAPANPPAGVQLPACFQHGLIPSVGPGQPIQEELLLVAPGQTPPPDPAGTSQLTGLEGATTLAFAGALLLGFGFRRFRARWLVLLLCAVGTLTIFSPLTACGGGNGMTPGSYTYIVTGTDSNAQATASTTFTVTIP